jgi:acetyl-CoA acetyltransferase
MNGIDFLNTREVVIVSGTRTPFGAYMGSLSGMTATELAVHASKGAIQKAGIDPKEIFRGHSTQLIAYCVPGILAYIL